MIRRLRTHWELIVNGSALIVAVVLACVLGPTLDAQSTDRPTCGERCGTTKLAAKE
ncbi:hypothetical protein [Bordetella genomosp. 1]|uniref:hypothetical protein n=1 Tax=Bordetella genomosp. 1 TaxID=1395607 RepID=UPI0015C6945D|nr:hypothetical protein [Bordetella genomosp. 1]